MKMNKPLTLFTVHHPNGKQWTREEVDDYLSDQESFLIEYWTFLVDEDGYPSVLDKCGQCDELDPDEFVVRWN